MSVTLRSWSQEGRLTGEAVVDAGQVTGGSGELPAVVRARAALIGGTPEQAVADLDGWSNGYVKYTTSGEPVQAWAP